MTIPTIAEAAAYVSLIEVCRGIEPKVLDVGVDFAGCREVTTEANYWIGSLRGSSK
jgi:hypothetical protein